ncbi:MAG: hypothetical protein LUD74_00060 [Tannerellaceae bacterium]|nr:hypothetical protein [Tannerellaceae bacterium]
MKQLLISLLLVTSFSLFAQTHEYKEFKDPPMQYRPIPLWFWNNTEVTKAGIKEQMKAMRNESGYGGVAILPFGRDFLPKYLTEEYFQMYKFAASQAKALGMKMSLYDEYGFPSGSGGAMNGDDTPRFRDRFPGQTLKRLDKFEFTVEENIEMVIPIPQVAGVLMSAVAMHEASWEIIPVKDCIQDGKLTLKLTGSRPTVYRGGSWKVMLFYCVDTQNPNVNYLDAEAVQNYVGMIHQAYFDRMGTYFGTVITTSFFDEPTLYREEGRAWTATFNDRFKQRFGFDCELLYPALWYYIGHQTYAIRNYFFTLRAELYAEGYIKTLDDWSRAHHIKATGHQDQEEALDPVGVSGDLMLSFKHMEIPGIDKIGGDRPAERFYKIVSSAAYNWDKHYVMSETYGAMGNLPYEEMYSIAMDQYAKGINMMIPHAVWYDTARVTFEPELSHRSPIYGKHLKEFNTFLARLNYFLRNAAAYQTNAAILYPINTLQAQHHFNGGTLGSYNGSHDHPFTDYVDISVWMTDLGIDHLFLHPEVLREQCVVTGSHLRLNTEAHPQTLSLLLIPSCETIDPDNLQRAKELFDAGGTVCFTSRLPVRASVLGKDRQVKELIAGLLPEYEKEVYINSNAKGGKVIFIPHPAPKTLQAAFNKAGFIPEVRVAHNSAWRYIHKVLNGKHLYYIANPGDTSGSGIVELPSTGEFELWNPHTGEVTPLHTTTIRAGENKSRLTLSLAPVSSVFIVEKGFKAGMAY